MHERVDKEEEKNLELVLAISPYSGVRNPESERGETRVDLGVLACAGRNGGVRII